MTCDFTNQCIPFELFLGLIGIGIALAIFGFVRQPQIPAMLTFGGMFVMFISVYTNNIEMGQLVTTSSLSGSTTSYNYTPDLFPLSSVYKLVFGLIGTIMMLSGAMMVFRGEDTTVW